MESPSAALEQRISELEQLVGEQDPARDDDRGSVIDALHAAARTAAASVCPTDPERHTRALRRAFALQASPRSALVPVHRAVLDDARRRVGDLELALRELAALTTVLDGDWRKADIAGGRGLAAVRAATVAAEAAEAAVAEESRAVDGLLCMYNTAVERMNARFELLVVLVCAVEAASGIKHVA
jgi:hypothetical protein